MLVEYATSVRFRATAEYIQLGVQRQSSWRVNLNMGYNHRLVLEFLLHAYDFTGAAAEERQEFPDFAS
jgi:hypothetical protein